jgi:predicted nuclease with TOPRIM domain
MNWLNILGAIGGSAGIVALIKAGIDLYMAKGNRTSVDVKNMQEMLDEAHKMFDEVVSKYYALEERMEKDRAEAGKYVDGLRNRILKIEEKSQNQEERINKMEKVINLAWRCKYPENVSDCPVIQEYEKRHLCDGCVK